MLQREEQLLVLEEDGTPPSPPSTPQPSSPAIPDDPLLFLSSVFPKLSKALLGDRLDSCGGDLETLVEILLNEDYIDSIPDTTPMPFTHAAGDMLLEKGTGHGTVAAVARARRKREKSNKKASQGMAS